MMCLAGKMTRIKGKKFVVLSVRLSDAHVRLNRYSHNQIVGADSSTEDICSALGAGVLLDFPPDGAHLSIKNWKTGHKSPKPPTGPMHAASAGK
mmetsp:Transcript_24014/g.38352  ORF Transcript_24014/g.38352 Transcript_24014/m.38352 type:complete len:94 (-) Transcript_24014:880-1161(-)